MHKILYGELMGSGVEDEVHWGQELKSLPVWVRSLIVAVRLGGMITVVVLLAGILIAQSLGLFNDPASIERRSILQMQIEILKQSKENERISMENKSISNQQSQLMEKHIKNTESISRSLCLLIPKITDSERRSCMNE